MGRGRVRSVRIAATVPSRVRFIAVPDNAVLRGGGEAIVSGIQGGVPVGGGTRGRVQDNLFTVLLNTR